MAEVWEGGKFGLGHVESEMTESSRNVWEALAPGRVGRPRRDPEAVREEETVAEGEGRAVTGTRPGQGGQRHRTRQRDVTCWRRRTRDDVFRKRVNSDRIGKVRVQCWSHGNC